MMDESVAVNTKLVNQLLSVSTRHLEDGNSLLSSQEKSQ